MITTSAKESLGLRVNMESSGCTSIERLQEELDSSSPYDNIDFVAILCKRHLQHEMCKPLHESGR